MRVRRIGLAALALVAGASLVPTSTGTDLPARSAARNLNFTLPALADADEESDLPRLDRGVWALAGRDAQRYEMTAAPTASWEGSDGVPFFALWLKVGRGDTRPVLTNALTAGDLLQALGIDLAGSDRVLPSFEAPLEQGMDLRVVRIRHVLESLVIDVPYGTLIRESRELAAGNLHVLRYGESGRMVRTFRITYRNGREVRRVVVVEVLLRAPVSEVVLEGTGGAGALTTGKHVDYGEASWYDFCRVDGMYAAHRTLPFGTRVTVTNLDNGKSVTVVINDRGPFGIPDRIIDLCDSAFAVIAPLEQGVARVRLSWSA